MLAWEKAFVQHLYVVASMILLLAPGTAQAIAAGAADKSKVPLLVVSKSACAVSVDGEKTADLQADEPVRVLLAPGAYLVSAVAADGRRWSKVVQVEGTKTIVQIEFAAPTPSVAAPPLAPPPNARPSSTAPQAPAVEHEPAPGALPWVKVPAGAFEMGCSEGDPECDRDEKPRRRVILSAPFEMMPRPVTVEEFRDWASASGRQSPKQPTWSTDDLPVVNVTWTEAHDFCLVYEARLPTETEWDYAARGGSPAAQYAALDDIAWYAGNSGMRAHAPAQKKPNAFGLYDMLGNVWEWCADLYRSTPGSDESGPSRARTEYVLRGGSWRNKPKQLRVSNRGRLGPGRTDRRRRVPLRARSLPRAEGSVSPTRSHTGPGCDGPQDNGGPWLHPAGLRGLFAGARVRRNRARALRRLGKARCEEEVDSRKPQKNDENRL